jgi:hypothetical protein
MISGEWIAATPIYGYSKTESGKWKINDAAACVIRSMYEMALLGKSFGEIRASLSEAGYPTPSEFIKLSRGYSISPKCQWTLKSVRAVLKNVQYTGTFVSGKELKNLETGKKFHTPESDWVVIPDRHPPIINKDVFDRVQQIVNNSRVRRKNIRKRDHLLNGGIVKCGCCGYALVYDPLASPVFRCPHTTADPTAKCNRMKVSVYGLEDTIMTIIRKQAEVVLNMSSLSAIHKAKADTHLIDDCEKQIQQLIEQRQQTYEQFVQRDINRDTFNSLKTDYAAQIDRLNNQLVLLKQADRERESGNIAAKKAATIANDVVSETATPKEIVNALIDKILVTPDNNIEIQWKFASFAGDTMAEKNRTA